MQAVERGHHLRVVEGVVVFALPHDSVVEAEAHVGEGGEAAFPLARQVDDGVGVTDVVHEEPAVLGVGIAPAPWRVPRGGSEGATGYARWCRRQRPILREAQGALVAVECGLHQCAPQPEWRGRGSRP